MPPKTAAFDLPLPSVTYLFTLSLSYMNLTHKSQSALEYLMTYGWAILIIVIVAVILYSMGLFNPSSSITFTSSGFSPFTVSSSLCNNLGYKIAVLAGPIPNNANSLTISKVYLTSATGANATTASYTLKNPVTLKSGQSATILIPNVACNAVNVHYSISANIQYSYTASTLGLQTVNTTGTVAGTSIAGKPSVLTSYEPLTITNSQPSATPNPFQQMVVFNSTDPGFSSIATGNFGQNVEFFYYNGTVVPSWLENYTTDNATWWLKIAAIPAGSSETVYVGFASTSTNLFNTVNDGEASYLNDYTKNISDINNVFIWGTDFIGQTLPVNVIINNANYSIDNGLTYKARYPYNSFSDIYLNQVFPNDILVGFRENLFANFTNGNWVSSGLGNITGLYHSQISGFTYGEVGQFSVSDIFRNYSSWSGVLVSSDLSNKTNDFLISQTTTPPYTTWFVNGIKMGLNGVSSGFDPNQFIASPVPIFFEDAAGVSSGASGTVPNPVKMYYYFVAQSPPNGIMPSVTFGSLS